MDSLRRSLFGIDGDKEEEKVQREKSFLLSKTQLWVARQKCKEQGQPTTERLMVDAKELLYGLKDRKSIKNCLPSRHRLPIIS